MSRSGGSSAAYWALVLSSVALIAGAVGIVAWRYSAHDAPTPATSTALSDMERVSDEWRPSAVVRSCDMNPKPVVLLTISDLAPQRGEMAVKAALCIPFRNAVQFAAAADGQPIVSGSRRSPQVDRRFRRARFTVYIFGEAPVSATQMTVRFADIFGPQAGVGSGFTPLTPRAVTLPLIGRPDAYPLDRLTTDSGLYVAGPEGFRLTSAAADGEGGGDLLPAELLVQAEPAVGDFDIDYGSEELSSGDGQSFRIAVEREASARAYVLVVLVAPMLLAVALGLMVTHGSGADFRNLLIGVAGATLALLPLRAVLVPADIVGQTLVDWCLGAELLVFVALGLLGLAHSIRAPVAHP